jgi:hypothetical protein
MASDAFPFGLGSNLAGFGKFVIQPEIDQLSIDYCENKLY